MVKIKDVVSQIRSYDQSVNDWVQSAPLLEDGKPLRVVFATPDRAFAAMQHIVQGRVSENIEEMMRNVPLPFCSIHRSSFTFDPERFHGTSNYFRALGANPAATKIYQSKFPHPYDITYQIEFWAKNREALNVLQIWSSTQFESFEIFLDVNFRDSWESWGTKAIPFENEGIVDHSNLEPGEGERVLRFSQGLTAKAWLVHEINTVPSVLEILQDVYVTASDVALDDLTADIIDNNPDDYPRIYRVKYDSSGITVEE